ncbi:uncharacterized protein TNCV_2142031 [Trichonephila clavipes]|uniref:RNase H type-1 domain-containing protein n=1 Tax=Trichonephila clavipes TaxID=2585209 RepID=A0A8X6RV69_TRICX|nr:uncharacterized protein TNCV_2142031 [Trichonephila clavipes]
MFTSFAVRVNWDKWIGTATKWGATQGVLTTVHKTYVHPVLDYGCEVVTLGSTTNLGKYDVVQNSGLRIITGGVKSTPITAMQLQTGIEPLDSRRDKFTLKFWERDRRVDYRYWDETLRLQTQTSPLSQAELLMKKQQRPLMTRNALIQFYSTHRHTHTVATSLPSKRLNLTNMPSNKVDDIPKELKSRALETNEEKYPANEWLHIYTDGSYLPETNGAGARWFCSRFEGSLAVGKNATNYDGEVLVVCEDKTHLLSAGLAPAKVIFFIESQAAILALSSAELKLQSSSHMARLRPYSGSQVMLGSPAMKKPIKKPSRERSRLNRKFP